MSKLKFVIKKIIGYKTPTQKLIEKGYDLVGKNSTISGLTITIKNKQKKVYLQIGDNCIINGSFIFETGQAKIEIGSNTFIGGGTFIAVENIKIGDDVMFSWGCTVSDTNAHSINWNERKEDVKEWKKGLDEGKEGAYKNWQHVKTQPVIIKNKCWIGFNSIILKGVTLAEECVVGAGSVVTKPFDEKCIIAGNPAKCIKKLV